MARKSRKQSALVAPVKTSEDRVYRCALYARISVENERKREADSIGNQLQLLKDYVSERPDLSIFDIYSDDDISGVDFIRPEFSRMMNDLRDGKIDCVIVKDLSRLGRNYLESGEYIELVFPFFQCRFIAINDRFDTKYQQPDFSVQLKNLANEMYAKDISKKILSVKRNAQEQGKFTAGRAPYGYLLDPEDKQHLIVDEETAPVVKEMYEMMAAGNTLHGVATMLNERGIPSPGRLLYDRGISTTDKFKNSRWFMPTVKRILTDEIYLGWMVLGKYRSTYQTTGQKGMKKVPRDEWITTKGTHAPIVTEELFYRVQDYFAKTREAYGQASLYNSKSQRENIFRGHLRCGECGRAMTFRKKKNGKGEKQGLYICPMHEHYNSDYCTKKAMKKEDLEEVVLKLIRAQMQLFTDSRELCLSLNKREASKTKHKIFLSHIRKIRNQIDEIMERKASLYASFVEGIINQEDYISMGQDYAQRADELRILLAEMEQDAQKYSPAYATTGSWSQLIEQYKDEAVLSSEMIDAFIEEVVVHNNGHVEVKFNFRDELDEVIHLAAIRKREVERYAL